MRKTIILAFVLLMTSTMAWSQDITTIILVRHAEKGFDEGGDPNLTEEGEQRALELARVLQTTSIDAIYTTPFKRTRQTVAPLAKQKELEIKEYNPFKLDEVLAMVEDNKGKTLVFSGHSNTTPVLVNKLIGAEDYKQLDESDYDNLYIVSLIGVGNGQVTSLEYGADSEL